jgi:hypothetical protein
VEDLAAFPVDEPLLVEGAALLPEIVVNLISGYYQALFVVPTPAFQQEAYAKRAWREEILRQCQDPEQAWQNWMARDVEYGRWIRASARHRGLSIMEVDGSRTVEHNARRVARCFRLDS